MLSFIVSFLLGSVLASGIAALIFNQKHQQQLKQHTQKISDLEASYNGMLSDTEQKIMLGVEAVGDNKQGYVKAIAHVLDVSADSADNTSQDIELLANKLTLLSNTATEITAESNGIKQVSQDSSENITLAINELAQLTQSQQDIDLIESQFADIQDKTQAIQYIGEEAEMLALNAAIEAARAGEAGRGFAVVADNMKLLAKNSQTSTVEILTIVNNCAQVIETITNNFKQRGKSLGCSINDLVDSFKHISESTVKMLQLIQTMSENAVNAEELSKAVEINTKNSVEMLVKDLSHVVSEITGKFITDLTPDQAKANWQKFDGIIDVRRKNEWNDELGHINGVKLSTLQTDFKQEVKMLDKNKSYLFICRSGGRSTKAAHMALALGVSSVSNLDGGMLAWRKSGF